VERVTALCIPHLQKAGLLPEEIDETLQQWVTALVKLYQEQLTYAAEIVQLTGLFFTEEVNYEEEAQGIIAEEQVPTVLASFLTQVEQTEVYSAESIKGLLKSVQTETGFKGKQLFMPIRAALTGQVHGRDLNETLFLLGKDKVMQRLNQLITN
jgi:nondiscriminating glutamyl-tRNA synthetase